MHFVDPAHEKYLYALSGQVTPSYGQGISQSVKCWSKQNYFILN